MIKYLTVLLFLPIIAHGQTNNGKNDSWKKYEKNEYSVQYPSDWKLDVSGQMQSSFIIISPLESTEDSFGENVNLIIQDLAGKNIDLNLYTEISEEQVRTLLPNSSIVESKRVKDGTHEYHKLIYTGEQGGRELVFEQYYNIWEDKAYVLTLTTTKSTATQYKETGEKILNSFLLKK